MRKELRALIEERNLQQLKALLTHMPVEQIVEILRELRPEEQVVLFRLLSKDKALETYETLTRNEQIALVQAMENPDILSLLLEMDTDEQAELLEELPAKVVNQVLQQLSPEARRQVNLLLGFPEGSVGRIMEPSYLARPLHATAGATLDWVRHSPLDPENLEEILVVGEGRLYKGYVTLSRLLKAHPETRLEQLLEGQEVYVSAYAPESEAAKLFLRHKLPLLPVVDRDGRLVGVVQTRRAFELLEEQETRQLVRFGGTLAVSPAGGPDLDVLGDPLKRLFLGRFVWLAILTFFGVFTSTFVAKQEEMLAQVIVLAAFIAPIIDMGGNTGSQTATLVIRAMALGQLRSAWRDFLRVVKRD
ncbi:MAG: CBS domain-containing protein, partial [Armatimonadota bacterium]|nr:CBS domain-containing protein [Armatimonadota bacterium]